MSNNTFRYQPETTPAALSSQEHDDMRIAYLGGYLALCGYNPNEVKALTPEATQLLYEASTSGWVPLSEINYLIDASTQEQRTLPGIELQTL